MFISQEKLEDLIDGHEYIHINRLAKNGDICLEGSSWVYETITIKELLRRIDYLEKYLDIHYEQKEVSGYVENKKK